MDSTKVVGHSKCRSRGNYPGGGPVRFPVSDDKVPWSVDYPGYDPPEYTADRVLQSDRSDEDIKSGKHKFRFNEVDKKVDRRSYTGRYPVVNGVPMNPVGRTGIAARGRLRKWGPNHAADAIATRWKRGSNGEQVVKEGKPVLQFIAIRRQDNGETAIPGGMVEAGEQVSETLLREFGEEALSSLDVSSDERLKIKALVTELFAHGDKIYEGYVDDPRNTDNAWTETLAINFHDDTGVAFEKFTLKAGDDAAEVFWADIGHELNLFASHSDFMQKVAEIRGAYY